MTGDASAAKLLPDKKYDKIFKETRNQTDGKLQDTEMDKDDIERRKKSCAEDTKLMLVFLDSLQDNKTAGEKSCKVEICHFRFFGVDHAIWGPEIVCVC